MGNDERLAELVERWAQTSGWQFHGDGDGAPLGVGWEDDRTRVDLAFFPANDEAMVELFDRRRVRGGILSILYGDSPGAVLDLLAKMGDPAPTKFPAFVSGLVEQFNEVYDASDAEPVLIDSAYLEAYVKAFQDN